MTPSKGPILADDFGPTRPVYRGRMPLYLRGIPLVLFLFRMWRRLPASQKKQVLRTLQRHGPRIAAQVAREARVRQMRARRWR
jgi:hypothetical protein